MLKKRIIPCLDIKDGRTVKGVNFVGLRDAGDPVELAIKYVDEGADELMFLDISTTLEKRKTLAEMVKKIPAAINIPFTVGGGINSVEYSSTVINVGADKVSVNSSAVKNPQLITDLSAQFGSQCIVVAVDTRNVNVTQKVFVSGGKEETDWGTLDWVKEVEKSGASEILLTSRMVTGQKRVSELILQIGFPKVLTFLLLLLVAQGKWKISRKFLTRQKQVADWLQVFFYIGEIPIPKLKNSLKHQNIAIR